MAEKAIDSFNANSEHQLVELARFSFSDSDIRTVMDACEAFYMNGCPDDSGGDVESPVGHYYRVALWIVQTDNQGFKEINAFHTTERAKKAFEELDEQFGKWVMQQYMAYGYE